MIMHGSTITDQLLRSFRWGPGPPDPPRWLCHCIHTITYWIHNYTNIEYCKIQLTKL